MGSFTCEVSNVRSTNGSDSVAKLLVACNITIWFIAVYNYHTQRYNYFIVGQSATATCVSDVPATRIEWLSGEDVLMASTTMSTQQLNLVFSLVSDSIHGQVYVCRKGE